MTNAIPVDTPAPIEVSIHDQSSRVFQSNQSSRDNLNYQNLEESVSYQDEPVASNDEPYPYGQDNDRIVEHEVKQIRFDKSID